MNHPADHENEYPNAGAPKTLQGRVLQLVAILVFGALFVGPLVTYGCSGEIGRWKAANAMLQFDQGKHEQAIAEMQQIVEDSNRDPVLTQSLASMLSEAGRAAESVELCDRWLEKSSSESAANRARMLETKASSQQHLGESGPALETMKELQQMLTSGRSVGIGTWVNNIAYYRALAGTELGLAADDMSLLLEQYENTPDWRIDRKIPFHAKTAISAALVLRELDRHEDAMEVVDEWVDRMDERVYEIDSQLVDDIYESSKYLPFRPEMEKDVTGTLRSLLDANSTGLAMLLTVRVLLHQQAGDDEAMEADRIRTASLGFESDWMAGRMPDTPTCISTLIDAHVYLDTRGYVYVVQGNNGKGLLDLNLAILASETLDAAMNSSAFNSIELSSQMANNEDRQRQLKSLTKTRAILLHHRMQAYRQMNRDSLADEDANSIRELGFDPDERLF